MSTSFRHKTEQARTDDVVHTTAEVDPTVQRWLDFHDDQLFLQRPYRYRFEPGEFGEIGSCLALHGFAVVLGVLDSECVQALRGDVQGEIDGSADMVPGESRVRHAFIEFSVALARQLGNQTLMNLNRLALGVGSEAPLTVHKSAAIVRMPGAHAVAWHSDFCGDGDFPLPPQNTGEVLLRDPAIPAGLWFYLNGSHPRKGGLAVIEDSHRADWPGPQGFELFVSGAGKSFRPTQKQDDESSVFDTSYEPAAARYKQFDVPFPIHNSQSMTTANISND